MTGTKIVIIVLVLIAVLFVILVVWGYGNNDSQKTSGDSKQDAKKFSASSHSFLRQFSQRLGSGPKLDAKQVQPQLTTFNLQSQPSYLIHVLPDKDHEFRQAKFTIEPPRSACAYVVLTADGDVPDDLRNQDSRNADDRNDFTLTVPKGGGTLRIDRALPSGACTVALQ